VAIVLAEERQLPTHSQKEKEWRLLQQTRSLKVKRLQKATHSEQHSRSGSVSV
jgi:hypothetical protein